LLGAGSALFVGGLASSRAAAQVVTPSVIIPAVDEFEGNYEGQFLTIRGGTVGSGDLEAVRAACGELPWPEDEVEQIEGQLTDRRSDEPFAVRLPVVLNGQQRPEQDDALFIISDATPCGEEYVQLQLSPIDLRNIASEESGPGIGEEAESEATEDNAAGLGLLAGAIGGVGGVLAWLRSARDSTSD
jgi:hypothetical protein